MNRRIRLVSSALGGLALLVIAAGHGAGTAHADETCMSPYMAKIVGQEDFVYVWTLGVEGLGDEQDKLVTIDVDPASASYGKVVHVLSVGGRNEAHHSGLTDDRRYLWAGGLDTNKIFVFDVHSDPAKPSLHQTITDFTSKSGGVVGPHTHYALPGRMMITGLSNNKDHGGRTALVEYTNEGKYVTTHWMPTDDALQGAAKTGQYADGYGYDVRVLPRRNVMVTSSFTGWTNYMMDFGKMLGDPEAMKRFGNTVVVWNLHTRKPRKIFDVPGAPLEIRCAWGASHDYCFTTTALTSQIWLIYEDEAGEWQAKAVADIGDPSKVPLPVDLDLFRRHASVGGHVHGRKDARVRHQRSPPSRADHGAADRQSDQHGLPELGWPARLLHLVAARELGQEGRGQRAVPEGLQLGRQGAHERVQHRLHRREARAPPPDALRRTRALRPGGFRPGRGKPGGAALNPSPPQGVGRWEPGRAEAGST
jgi:selenium-binding protein 1